MKHLMFLALPLLVASVAAPADAKGKGGGLKWMDAPGAGLPAGAKLAVVKGDPSKAAPFVIRARMPANYTVPPHSHPTDETVRVRSGGPLAYGMGDKVDTSNAGSLTKGYHVTLQSGMHHWASVSAPTEIEVSGTGPFAITYVNPKDDPRNKGK